MTFTEYNYDNYVFLPETRDGHTAAEDKENMI